MNALDTLANAKMDLRSERFARCIASGMTQTQAYVKAGYTGNNASANATNLARSPHIRARVQTLIEEALAVEGITADRTKRELSRVAFADVRALFTNDGRLKSVHELDDDIAAAVTSVQVETRVDRHAIPDGEVPGVTTITRIKLAPKMEALGLLSRHFKIVGDTDDGVNSLANALADRLNDAKRRLNTGEVEDIEPIEETEEAPARIMAPGIDLETLARELDAPSADESLW